VFAVAAVLVKVNQSGNVELTLIWYVCGPKVVVFCVTVPLVIAVASERASREAGCLAQ
jgi:hypothetical protein